MTILQQKLTNSIGKNIDTPFGLAEVVSVDSGYVTFKGLHNKEFKLALWQYGQYYVSECRD